MSHTDSDKRIAADILIATISREHLKIYQNSEERTEDEPLKEYIAKLNVESADNIAGMYKTILSAVKTQNNT